MSDVTFRLPIHTAVALGVNQTGDEHKAPDDVEADLNLNDQALEDFLSQFGTTAGVAAAQTSTVADFYANVGNVGTGETDLVTKTLNGGLLAANGYKVFLEAGGTFVSSGTATRQVRVYFGGTVILDTGALTVSLSAAWTVKTMVMRVSATVVRYSVTLATEGAALAAYTAVGEVTGLTLSTPQVFKITGQAAGVGAATNDIVAKLATYWTMNAA